MPGILFAHMEPPAEIEDEFNRWYDEDHVPSRLGVPGFRAAHRYRQVGRDRPAYTVVYELDDPGVVQTPEYKEMQARTAPATDAMISRLHRFYRAIAGEISVAGDDLGPVGHDYLYVVAFPVPDEDVEQFDAWYDTEHVPLLLRAEGWRRCRRYTVTESNGTFTRLALHDLDDPSVLDSPERAEAGGTPWRTYLTRKPWFGKNERWVYERIRTATA
ncbi:MAG TPA: hypothetical protein VIL48_03805 [Acidimicrobiales bacterium]